MNYKDVVNRIQTIVEDHKMLVDFGYGQVSDIKTRAQGTEGEADGADYPYLFLNPTQHVRTQQQITYNFNMIVMDMAREEEAHEYQNFLNIQSDSIQYIDDVVARLYYYYKDKPEVSMDLNYTPFYERFQDDLAGATASLSITVPNSINECIAPFNPEPLPPVVCIPTLTIFSTNQNEVDYVRDPDLSSGLLRYEDPLTENPVIGVWTDQYLQAMLPGSYELEINTTFEFAEPTGNEQLAGVPHLTYFANPPGVNVEVAPTCDSGNWPTVWSADPITYNAIYNLTLEQTQNFIGIRSLDNGGDYANFTMKAGGTLDIGFDGVIPQDPIPPIANYTSDITTVNAGSSVQFTDTSTVPAGGPPITDWLWTFVGVTPMTSTSQNPSIQYDTVGSYQVVLQVTNADGSDTRSTTNYITVEAVSLPVSRTYNATLCGTGTSFTHSYTSVDPLAPGTVIKNQFASCWTISNITNDPALNQVIEIFTDCVECNL